MTRPDAFRGDVRLTLMTPRVLVVQNDADKPLGRIAHGLVEAGVELDTRMSAGHLPGLAAYDGLITLPGLANPDDDTPALRRVRAAIESALERAAPVLGLCLGGQLLAEALGGTTYRSRAELGFRAVTKTPQAAGDPLLTAAPDRFSIFHAHAYAFNPPPDAVVLLENDVCIQACRLGEAWAFQCHPEPELEWIEELARGIRGERSLVGPGTIEFFTSNGVDPDALADMGREAGATAATVADSIAHGFAARVLAQARASQSRAASW